MDRFIRQLAGCTSTSEILDLTLAEAAVRNLGVKSIRYYRLGVVGQQEYLESVDCSGHAEPVPTSIRAGRINLPRRRSGERPWDATFEVIDSPGRRPVIFQIEPTLTVSRLLVSRNPVPFYLVKTDGCNGYLGDDSARDAWADVSLVLGGRACGKLSCSLVAGRLPPGEPVPAPLLARLLDFQDLVTVAAPYLESLTGFDLNSTLEEAGREIFNQHNYIDLYRYLTHEHGLKETAPFNYEAADVLIVSSDTIKRATMPRDSELLILRDSSYDAAERDDWIDRRYYRQWTDAECPRPWLAANPPGEGHPPGIGLTPWVWRTGRPLRLNDDPDDTEFTRQLANYDRPSSLTWRKNIPAAAAIRSLLIVPIFDPRIRNEANQPKPGEPRRVLGVIRFVNKKDRTPIDPREEVLLQRIADRCIGPRLISLKFEEFTTRLTTDPEKLLLMRPTAASDDETRRGAETRLLDTLKQFFPMTGGKVFLFNRVVRGTDQFEPSVIHKTRPEWEAIAHKRYPVVGSLTGYCLRATPRDPNRQFVFVNDTEYAEHAGHYLRELPGVCCALAAPVQFKDERYGALVVLSDRYDLISAAFGPLLQVIGRQLGWLIKDEEIKEFAVAAVKGVEHDVPALLRTVARRAGSDAGAAARGIEFANTLIHAYSYTEPPPPLHIQNRARSLGVPVRAAIEEASEMAAAVALDRSDGTWADAVTIAEAPDAEAWVEPCFLNACLFNLLKNALTERERDTPVTVTAQLDADKGLIVEVANVFRKPIDEERLCRPPSLPIGPRYEDAMPRNIGVVLTRILARWHALPTGDATGPARGDLAYSKTAGRLTARLRLPVSSPG